MKFRRAKQSAEGTSAVDHEGPSRHEAGVRASQEGHRPGNVLWRSGALDSLAVERGSHELGRQDTGIG
jgi:hypothetical protein